MEMPFEAILHELTERSGASGAVLLGADGDMVASFTASPALEMDLIGAHHGVILNIVRDAAERLDEGPVKAISITTGASRITVCSLKEDLCLVLVMKRQAQPGKALMESRRAIVRIEKELGC